MTPKDVIKFAKEKGVQIVDLRFADMPGTWQHFSITAGGASEKPFSPGHGFLRGPAPRVPTTKNANKLLFPHPPPPPLGTRIHKTHTARDSLRERRED